MSRQRERVRRVNAKRPGPLTLVVEHPANDEADVRERAIAILWRLLDRVESGEA
jgi:hypothetical protein